MLGLHKPRADADGLVEEAPGVLHRPKPVKLCPIGDARTKCSNCKASLAQAVIGNEKRCSACIDELLVKRLISVLKVHHALSHGDAVLAAVSGGPSSMALADLLDRVHAKRCDRLTRGEVIFRLQLAHVNMAAAFAPPMTEQLEEHAARTVAHLRARHGADSVHSLRIEDVYTDDRGPAERAAALQSLLASVQDSTAKQDVLACLRDEVLQRRARKAECNKLVLGSSASQLASGFLAALSKGQGFRAPADLQLADAREGSAACCIVRPLRNISRKELALHAHFRQLPFRAMPRLNGSRAATVNSLCDALVADLHVANPGALSTVMKTACKLRPFEFNDITLASPPPLQDQLPFESLRSAARRQGEAAAAPNHAGAEASRNALCSLCRAPLHPSLECLTGGIENGTSNHRGDEDEGTVQLVNIATDRVEACALAHKQRLCRSCQALCMEGDAANGSNRTAKLALNLLPATCQARLAIMSPIR